MAKRVKVEWLFHLPTERQKEAYNNAGKDVTEGKKNKMMVKDTLIVRLDNQKELDDNSRNSDRKASLKREQQKNVDDIINLILLMLHIE